MPVLRFMIHYLNFLFNTDAYVKREEYYALLRKFMEGNFDQWAHFAECHRNRLLCGNEWKSTVTKFLLKYVSSDTVEFQTLVFRAYFNVVSHLNNPRNDRMCVKSSGESITTLRGIGGVVILPIYVIKLSAEFDRGLRSMTSLELSYSERRDDLKQPFDAVPQREFNKRHPNWQSKYLSFMYECIQERDRCLTTPLKEGDQVLLYGIKLHTVRAINYDNDTVFLGSDFSPYSRHNVVAMSTRLRSLITQYERIVTTLN